MAFGYALLRFLCQPEWWALKSPARRQSVMGWEVAKNAGLSFLIGMYKLINSIGNLLILTTMESIQFW